MRKSDKKIKHKFTICDGCPCLNDDYEQGCSCNLNYNTDYFRVDKNERIFKQLSPDCGLENIKYIIRDERGIVHTEFCPEKKIITVYFEKPMPSKLCNMWAHYYL